MSTTNSLTILEVKQYFNIKNSENLIFKDFNDNPV
jgi:hypothetical protein